MRRRTSVTPHVFAVFTPTEVSAALLKVYPDRLKEATSGDGRVCMRFNEDGLVVEELL